MFEQANIHPIRSTRRNQLYARIKLARLRSRLSFTLPFLVRSRTSFIFPLDPPRSLFPSLLCFPVLLPAFVSRSSPPLLANVLTPMKQPPSRQRGDHRSAISRVLASARKKPSSSSSSSYSRSRVFAVLRFLPLLPSNPPTCLAIL